MRASGSITAFLLSDHTFVVRVVKFHSHTVAARLPSIAGEVWSWNKLRRVMRCAVSGGGMCGSGIRNLCRFYVTCNSGHTYLHLPRLHVWGVVGD